jgi:hypothetical protein
LNEPFCSIVITAYNAASDLPACLDGLIEQKYPHFEIIVVDNASLDKTSEVTAHYSPFIRCVRLPVNRAVAGGYNAGAAAAEGEILIFINADTIPQPGWLQALVEPLTREGRVGMTTSRILLADAPHLVNTCGNDITWTGLTVCRGLGEPADRWLEPSQVAAVSGAAFAIRRSLFEAIGGFDETFEFYLDDTDLSLRSQLAGYQAWFVPASLIHHRYGFKFSTHKAYYQERNRWLVMLKTMRLPTLLLLLPGLTFGEGIAWVYSGLKGKEHLRAKLAGWQWLWRNRRKVQELRHQTQALRKVSDRELLRIWSPKLRFRGTVSEWPARILEGMTRPLLAGYGAFCRLLAVW